MDEFKNKNDYSVQVYFNRNKRLFTEYVHSIYSYSQWLQNQGIEWDYILIYVRRSRNVLCYYKKGEYIHSKPNYNNRGNIKNGW